jgi:predicted PurR-regulated permease PerM
MKKIRKVKFDNSLQIYTFAIIGIALLAMMFLILRSFWVSMFLAVVMAYLLQPVYGWMVKKKRFGKKLSTLLVVLLFTIIVFTPIVLFIGYLFSEMVHVVDQIDSYLNSPEGKETLDTIGDFIYSAIGKDVADPGQAVGEAVKNSAEGVVGIFFSLVASVASSLLGGLTNLVLFYAILVSLIPIRGEIRKWLFAISPFDDAITYVYTHRTGLMTKDMVVGTLVVGLGYAIGVGGMFYIVGVPFWAFAGFAAFLLSFLPIIGPSLITVPVAIFIGLSGDWPVAIGMILFHFLVLNNMELVVRPLIVSEDAKVNSVLMILVLIGGIAQFGLMGVFIGPILLVLFLTTVEVFLKAMEGYKPKGTKITKV